MDQAVSFSVLGRSVALYGAENADAPLVVLNNYSGSGAGVWRKCREAACPPMALAVVSGLDWDDDMTPWPCPPLSPRDTPCAGKAEAYLKLLLGGILPAVRERLSGPPSYAAVAGYSLAGLFALYAAFRCDAFARVASMSGSLWYPQFSGFAESEPFARTPECLYLSLGDAEARTRHPLLKTVRENTERFAALCRTRGVPSVFELNPGNHFADCAGRTARGIQWILEYQT